LIRVPQVSRGPRWDRRMDGRWIGLRVNVRFIIVNEG
jgi:hypothetical protein